MSVLTKKESSIQTGWKNKSDDKKHTTILYVVCFFFEGEGGVHEMDEH